MFCWCQQVPTLSVHLVELLLMGDRMDFKSTGSEIKTGINDVARLGTRLPFKPVTDEAGWL